MYKFQARFEAAFGSFFHDASTLQKQEPIVNHRLSPMLTIVIPPYCFAQTP